LYIIWFDGCVVGIVLEADQRIYLEVCNDCNDIIL